MPDLIGILGLFLAGLGLLLLAADPIDRPGPRG